MVYEKTKCPKCETLIVNYEKCINCGYYNRDNAKKFALEKIAELETKLSKLDDMLESKKSTLPPTSDIYSPSTFNALKEKYKNTKSRGSLPKGFKHTIPTPSSMKGLLPKGYRITSVDTPTPTEKYFDQYGYSRFIDGESQKTYKQKTQKISGFTKLLLGLGIAKIKTPQTKVDTEKQKTKSRPSRGTLPKGF